MTKGAVVLIGAAGGIAARRVLVVRGRGYRSYRQDRAEDGTRWRVVTVNRKPDEVAPEGRLPEPLAELGEAIEVQVRAAPGDRGTELAARLRQPEPSGLSGAVARLGGKDRRQAVRSALREAKQLLETGEVLQADRPTTTRRTLRGMPLEMATRRAGGEGRL